MTAPDRTHLGDTGDAVLAWQAYLVRRGYRLDVDGKHGPITERASLDHEQTRNGQQQAAMAQDEAAIRQRIVALALDAVGVSCRTQAGREAYLRIVAGPGDTDSAQQAYLSNPRTSGCALVCRGLLRLAGLRHAVLESRYRPGMAPSDLQTIARESGAWVTSPRSPVHPGDMVLINRPNGGHFYTVVRIDPAPRSLCALDTVDGGASDHGAQSIAARHRSWALSSSGRIVDTCRGQSYDVLGWVDVGRLRW